MIVEKNDIFQRFGKVQERNIVTAKQVVRLRDQHQALDERDQLLKEKKYEDKILRVNLDEMYLED